MSPQQIAFWSLPITIFSVSVLAALGVRQLVLSTLKPRPGSWGAALLEALRGPSVLWCLALGVALALPSAGASESVRFWAGKIIGVTLIVSIGLVAANVAVTMVALYGERRSLRIAGLSRTLIYIVIFSIVFMMVLSEFEVQITPMLTALGVGGLAVALALQDTLANLFAGIHILIEEPVRVGDFIRLSAEEEGTVRDIGWRTTRIQTFGNSIIVIPNQKITSGVLTNFSLATMKTSVEVVMVAAHHAEPQRMAAIAMDAAAMTEGVADDPPPAVWFDPGVLPTHMQMKLIAHVESIGVRRRVQSELRARIHEAFLREQIPFPEIRQ